MAKINKKNTPKKDTLTALTSAALLLSGANSNSHADAQPDATTLGYRYSLYSEDNLDRDLVAPGSTTERYEIDIHQFQIVAPLAETFSVKLDMQYEDMSGASPWQTEVDPNGDPRLIMSGASINDQRREVAIKLNRHRDDGRWSVFYQYSDEDDYTSNAGGVEFLWEFNQDISTVSTGFSYADDDIKPTQGIFPTGTLKDDKQKSSVYISGSHIINARSIIQTALSYTYHEGYLDDPYKYNDRRPDERKQWAWTANHRYFIDYASAALHTDYRFYDDDWGLRSHTLRISWYQNIGSRWQLVPFLRYYSQSKADFFGNEARDHIDEQHFSDDYRLSAYGAISGGLKINYQLDNWLITVSGERYHSDADLALDSDNEEAPGLVDFTRFTTGFTYRFE